MHNVSPSNASRTDYDENLSIEDLVRLATDCLVSETGNWDGLLTHILRRMALLHDAPKTPERFIEEGILSCIVQQCEKRIAERNKYRCEACFAMNCRNTYLFPKRESSGAIIRMRLCSLCKHLKEEEFGFRSSVTNTD